MASPPQLDETIVLVAMAKIMQKITPFLWYAKEAEEAAAFYASIFPDSRVTRVASMPSESPSGPPGSVKVVEFVLFGQPFVAMSAGPLDPFNHAVSFVVNCDRPGRARSLLERAARSAARRSSAAG